MQDVHANLWANCGDFWLRHRTVRTGFQCKYFKRFRLTIWVFRSMINKKMEELKAGAAVRRDVPMAKATENDWVCFLKILSCTYFYITFCRKSICLFRKIATSHLPEIVMEKTLRIMLQCPAPEIL